MTRLWFAASALAAGLMSVGQAVQAGTGRISGVILDKEGAAIPGATVTVVGEGQTRKVVTDSSGAYRVEQVPPGTYKVDAIFNGFRRASCPAVVVQVNRSSDCSLALKLGILLTPDFFGPGDRSILDALRAADVARHFRIRSVLGPRLFGPDAIWLTTEHVAVVLGLLKGPERELSSGTEVHIWQALAGEWVEDGRRYVAPGKPYVK